MKTQTDESQVFMKTHRLGLHLMKVRHEDPDDESQA